MLYETKVLKYLKYMPNVFMIKHLNGFVTKISLTQKYTVDCTNYVSRSGMTFDGCLKFNNEVMENIRGIYYVPIKPRISLQSRKKIVRNFSDMKDIIANALTNYGLTDSKLLITYDNYGFEAYDRFVKGELYQFHLAFNKGNLEIYEVPPPKNVESLNMKNVTSLPVYIDDVEFSKDVSFAELYSIPGISYLIYTETPTDVKIKSLDYGESVITLKSYTYYLVTHAESREHL